MPELPRLNGVIRALEQGQAAFTCFTTPDVESAIALSTTAYDGIVFEMEHNPWDIRALRDCLQYMLNRRQIASSGSIAPAVTPLVRIPPNGGEMNQAYAKQALDLGAYGIVWPHISTVEHADSAVGACRYPRLPTAPLYEPRGIRGDAPTAAARFWGLTQQEYYTKADVWPLDPQGEILVILMIEGDLGQELGFPRQYDHPTLRGKMAEVVATCKQHDVPVGHPHVDANNVERILAEGYRYLMAAPPRSYP